MQRQLGITFVYVTHDQGEALSMSDRVAVFNRGRIEQLGPPAEIYEHPASAFVAGFVGVSNLLTGAVAERISGQAVAFSIRPEQILLAAPGTAPPDGARHADGRIASILYYGALTRYLVALDGGGELAVVEQNRAEPGDSAARAQGAAVRLLWPRSLERQIAGAAT